MEPGEVWLIISGPKTDSRDKLQQLILANNWPHLDRQFGKSRLEFSLLLAGPEMVRIMPSKAVLAFLEYARDDPKAICQLYLANDNQPDVTPGAAGKLINAFSGKTPFPGWLIPEFKTLNVLWPILCIIRAYEQHLHLACPSNGELAAKEG